MKVAKHQLGLSKDAGIVVGTEWKNDLLTAHSSELTEPGPGESLLLQYRAVLDKHLPLESVKRLETRPETLAEFLRQCLTAKDLKDIKAAIPGLKEQARRSGHDPKRVPEVLRQLLQAAGL